MISLRVAVGLLLEEVAKADEHFSKRASVGPQYSFFDNTGTGSFARTGSATAEKCLENLFTKVTLFGFTDLFDEFCIMFGYLLRCPNIVVATENDTAGLNADAVELKLSLTPEENEKVSKLYGDDVWFFEQARKEYQRRISDPRIEPILREAGPSVLEAGKALQAVKTIPDPCRTETSRVQLRHSRCLNLRLGDARQLMSGDCGPGGASRGELAGGQGGTPTGETIGCR